jgi:Gene product 63
MSTPNAMPQNIVRQTILADLIKVKPASRTHKVWDTDTKDVVETTVPMVYAPTGLAANVSSHTVERIARRWMR